MADSEKKPNWFSRHKFLTGLIIFIVIGIIGSSGDDNTSGGANNAGSSPSPTPQAQEITYEKVEVKGFIDEFDQNQLAAETKYKNKYVEFSGKIKNISEDITSNPFLSIEPPSAGEYYFGTTVKCTFKTKEELLQVKNKQVVTVRGQVKTQSLGIITLDTCSLVN